MKSIIVLFCAFFAYSHAEDMSTSSTMMPMTMGDKNMVSVTVYYETLCPDSIKFVTMQLAPTWNSLNKYLNVTLVPYGKSTKVGSEGAWNFTCHHGEPECYGNKVHSCALKYVTNQKQKIDFINCTMATVKRDDKMSHYPGEMCANELKIVYDDVKRCADGMEGGNLLAMEGEMTDKYQNPLKSVPAVVLMGPMQPSQQNDPIKDLKRAVCSYFGEKNMPHECMSGAPMTTGMIAFAMLAVAFSRFVA